MEGTVAIATIALVVHSLSAVVWVGGMFFAHQILRPAALLLDPGPRFELWSRVLSRFFSWVIAAILLILASGLALVYGVFGGFPGIGLHVDLMTGIGILMILIFFHVYFAPFRRFRRAVGLEDWALASRQLAQIRVLVGINLLLGLLTIALATSGRYWA
jgi:uncharacterized membrane protein